MVPGLMESNIFLKKLKVLKKIEPFHRGIYR
jgi:hypothetical protein